MEGNRQEWSLGLNLTQHGKTYRHSKIWQIESSFLILLVVADFSWWSDLSR